jgi:hypothetical protein
MQITEPAVQSDLREKITPVVECYIHGLGARDFSGVAFAPDFTYESPLLMATVGQPRLIGQQAIDYLTGLFPAIRGTKVKQHIVEGEYCATVFDFDTIFGTIPVIDRFRVVGGELKLANPFYDPAPILKATEQQRRSQLQAVAEQYFQGLRNKDFTAIPYDDAVRLRAPLAPGGVNQPLDGKAALERDWWQPLQPALDGAQVKILDVYLNETLTGVMAEAELTITVLTPPVTLRVADRFTVNEAGRIIDQENHFDPRDVTNPGWQQAPGR